MRPAFTKTVLLLLAVATILALPLVSTSLAAPRTLSAEEFQMRAPAEVVPFNVKGQNALCYELAVSDVSKYGLLLQSVEILEGGVNGAVLKRYADKVLKQNLRKPSAGILDNTVFIWIRRSSDSPVPQTLFHRVRLQDTGSGETLIVEGAPVNVGAKTTLILKPPVIGSEWAATETASYWRSHHRKGIMDLYGKPYISQRTAIDWLQFGPNGLFWKTDGKSNEDYYCYGQPLLAVADAVVVDAKDGIPDNVPDPSVPKAVPITFGTVGGNNVVLKIKDGVYAHYCHMIPGSLAVKIGDKVKAGDVLGKLGNSGNSVGAHLHFHISDGPDVLCSNGLPYEFESYVLQGTARVRANDNPPRFDHPVKEKLFADDYPLNGSVLRFDR